MIYKYIVSFDIIGAKKHISTVVESDRDSELILEIDIYRILERIYGIRRSFISNVNYCEFKI